MNFDHNVNEYRRYLWQNNYSKNTIKSYTTTIRQFFKNNDLEKISQEDLNKIAVELFNFMAGKTSEEIKH